MAKNTRPTVADFLETRREKGATELWLEGLTGEGLRLYRGGPKDAAEFRRTLVRVLNSIHRAGATT